MEAKAHIATVAHFPHYRDHIQPVWDALPDEIKRPIDADSVLLVAGGIDSQSHPSHEYIWIEHGCGQSFGTNNTYYVGGDGHDRCKLFIAPHKRAADRWRARYPETPAVAVGCPKLDLWHRGDRPSPESRSVVIAFHWDNKIYPEARSAFDHYRKDLKEAVASFRAQGWQVLGHAHPRIRRRLGRFWSTLGVEHVETCSEVFDRASVLVTDSPSLTAEFMSLDRPVLALNAPWYRRDVSHGERFWDWPLHYIESAPELAETALEGLESAHWHPYAYADGRAAQRASEAILDLLCEPDPAASARDIPGNSGRDGLRPVNSDL